MRKLKYHEQKLLKKVDFLKYPKENTLQESKIMGRFHIQKRNHYMKYRRLVSSIFRMIDELEILSPNDSFRIGLTQQLTRKLHSMGVIHDTSSLSMVKKLTVSSFCRRRFPVVLVKLKFVSNLKDATSYIESGHLRIGPEIVVDPAYLVTREQEDFITWLDSSKIRRHIDEYNNQVDDYE